MTARDYFELCYMALSVWPSLHDATISAYVSLYPSEHKYIQALRDKADAIAKDRGR